MSAVTLKFEVANVTGQAARILRYESSLQTLDALRRAAQKPQGDEMKKVKNNKSPVFPRWKYVGEFKNGKLARMATYELIKVEG